MYVAKKVFIRWTPSKKKEYKNHLMDILPSCEEKEMRWLDILDLAQEIFPKEERRPTLSLQAEYSRKSIVKGLEDREKKKFPILDKPLFQEDKRSVKAKTDSMIRKICEGKTSDPFPITQYEALRYKGLGKTILAEMKLRRLIKPDPGIDIPMPQPQPIQPIQKVIPIQFNLDVGSLEASFNENLKVLLEVEMKEVGRFFKLLKEDIKKVSDKVLEELRVKANADLGVFEEWLSELIEKKAITIPSPVVEEPKSEPVAPPVVETVVEEPPVPTTSVPRKVLRKIAIYGPNNKQQQKIITKLKNTDLDITFYASEVGAKACYPANYFEKVFIIIDWTDHARERQVRDVYPKDFVRVNGGINALIREIVSVMHVKL